jgi:arsenite methyltransferase
MPNSSGDSSGVPQCRQMIAPQSPQLSGSATSRAHRGQYSRTGCDGSGDCGLGTIGVENVAYPSYSGAIREESLSERPQNPDQKLQLEFNRWAEAGEGEKMHHHHLDITEKTIQRMDLRPGERVLDLGCGAGWATRLLARLVADGPEGFGQVVGVDVSDEMIRRARVASKDFENILYVWGSAQQIPWEENFFDKMLSVESFYYYADQDRALAELFRVMAPHGRMFILINLYKDNPYSLQWVDKLKVPVHVRSEVDYIELLKKHAFENVEARRIPDDTPTPDDYQTKSFNSLEDLRAFKRIGALLLMASKPDLRTPAPGYTIY